MSHSSILHIKGIAIPWYNYLIWVQNQCSSHSLFSFFIFRKKNSNLACGYRQFSFAGVWTLCPKHAVYFEYHLGEAQKKWEDCRCGPWVENIKTLNYIQGCGDSILFWKHFYRLCCYLKTNKQTIPQTMMLRSFLYYTGAYKHKLAHGKKWFTAYPEKVLKIRGVP